MRPKHPDYPIVVDIKSWQRDAAVVALAEAHEEEDAVIAGHLPAGWMAPAVVQHDSRKAAHAVPATLLPRRGAALQVSRSGGHRVLYGQPYHSPRQQRDTAGPATTTSLAAHRSPRQFVYALLDTQTDEHGIDPEDWVERDMPLFDPAVPHDSFYIVNNRKVLIGKPQVCGR